MKTYKVDFTETGWQNIPGDTETIIVHYRNGEKKTLDVVKFLTLCYKEKKQITQIDCYNKSEQIPE